MKKTIEKYIDLLKSENPAYDIQKYIAFGWYIAYEGLTYIKLEKIIDD